MNVLVIWFIFTDATSYVLALFGRNKVETCQKVIERGFVETSSKLLASRCHWKKDINLRCVFWISFQFASRIVTRWIWSLKEFRFYSFENKRKLSIGWNLNDFLCVFYLSCSQPENISRTSESWENVRFSNKYVKQTWV